MTFSTAKFIPRPRQRLTEWRCAAFVWALIACLSVLPGLGVLRLAHFGESLDSSIVGTYHRARTLHAHRGDIRDRGGLPLAMNVDVYHAYADPKILRQKNKPEQIADLAERVATILGADPGEILRRMESTQGYVRLKNKIPAGVAARLSELKNGAGIGVEYDSARYYPNGAVAAHVIGFTNDEGVGKEGVEFVAQENLAESPGRAELIKIGDKPEKPIWFLDYTDARDGSDQHLSIDLRMQFFAHAALRRAVARHGAKAASAVLMDAQSGEILAMANIPSFNPNIRTGGADIRRNRAVTDLMEPGSTAKPFVAALALQAGLTRPDEILPTTKPLHVRPLTVRDKHIREDLTVAEVVQKSSNIGAVLLARRVGAAALGDLYHRVGFGGGKLLRLPGEAGGKLRPSEDWRPSDFATHAYGYGFSTNLLQLCRSYSVFANDGVLISPMLSPAHAGGGAGEFGEGAGSARIFDASTARLMREIMEGVATPDGSARAAAIPGYRVAGKTGTADKLTGGKYDSKRVRAIFVGMAPASRPRFIAAVMVDEPVKNGMSGGAAAAPVFRELMTRALLANGVAPDDWDWQNARPMERTKKIAQQGGNHSRKPRT